MKNKMRQIGMGLIFGLFAMFASEGQAQITKGVKGVTNTVTKPLKNVQNTTRDVTQPVKDINTGVRDIKNAPRDVKNEVKRTTSEVDRAGNDIKRTKQEISSTTSGLKSNKKDSDSTATKSTTTSNKETVVIDERRDRDAPGEGQADISHNPELPQSTAKTTTKAPDPFEVKGPEKKAEPVATSGDRGVHVPPPAEKSTLAPRAKPDHSNSPARYALERADFDVETLYDLFASADWEGVGKDHTVRSIKFTLEQLKNDINEIKRMDPNADTSYYTSRYKEWYADYTRRAREEEPKNEVIIE